MTDKEKYIEGQEASGIAVGDTVKVVSGWLEDESGSYTCRHVEGVAGTVGVVEAVNRRHLGVQFPDKSELMIPYFALEIVKKADGSMPSNETLITGELSMSTQVNFECKAILTDKETDVMSVVGENNRLFEESATEAKRRFSMMLAETIVEAEQKGKVEILCRPFLSSE